jgi:DNA-binding NarL/FixJ family response regulator
MNAAGSDLARLSRRQRQVVWLIAAGHHNDHIARDLGVGVGTVKKYVNQAGTALGARNRWHALVRARETGQLW